MTSLTPLNDYFFVCFAFALKLQTKKAQTL